MTVTIPSKKLDGLSARLGAFMSRLAALGEVAPRQGEELAGAWRLHDDGQGARADRTGDRAPAAAGADEIAPGSCMSPLVVKAAITAVEGLTLAKSLSNRQVPHR